METGILETRAARFSDRFIAYLLDTVPFGAGAFATVWVLLGPLAKAPTPELLALVGASWTVLIFAYQFLGNLSGATAGKRMIGLRVIARDGGPAGVARSLIRAFVWLVGSTAGNFGFVVALFNRENRALHDYASGTVVVETYRKSSAEGAALFLAGALGALGLFGFQLYSGWARPTAQDRAAVARARAGLDMLAQVEEAHRMRHGAYAATLDELAETSGSPDIFRTAMDRLFMPTPFKIEAGNRGWRIRAAARDRARTIVVREGPQLTGP